MLYLIFVKQVLEQPFTVSACDPEKDMEVHVTTSFRYPGILIALEFATVHMMYLTSW